MSRLKNPSEFLVESQIRRAFGKKYAVSPTARTAFQMFAGYKNLDNDPMVNVRILYNPKTDELYFWDGYSMLHQDVAQHEDIENEYHVGNISTTALYDIDKQQLFVNDQGAFGGSFMNGSYGKQIVSKFRSLGFKFDGKLSAGGIPRSRLTS